ncbi:PP2C family protein-serine/threonine phosphatase [Streptomyces sp. ST2-7A]|uniref:PP2C family protein-serine/threonine phosphatase n=1 Tax=Streptomyces sp. ST2-7A TaxID=2907214 RepID=UPI001F1E8D0A|nr:SpoIIE family protein phosphatase [Streptomyces sp. ST2-7A]MCE7079143.1 SpoIIE family protein phosphatase [Streptomyces sp. ST2-7A]
MIPPEADGDGSPRGGEVGADSPAHGPEAFTALLEDSAEDLYEHAPCGYLSTLLDGEIARINGTLLGWLGLAREDVVGRMRFSDLLTVGGRLYHETHFAPLLLMQGEISGIALELRRSDGGRLPVLVTSKVKTGTDGRQQLIRTTVFDARERRAYENELLRARLEAEKAATTAERERETAERERLRLREVLATLQRSLLPPSLPPVPNLEAAAYYHTASPDHVGGDFYDLFPLGEERWGFFLGDVCGKGPEAAAVTSLIRYTLRAAVLHEPDAVGALRSLNGVLREHGAAGDPRHCTVIAGSLSPVRTGESADGGHGAPGGYEIRLAGGGHPPALLLRSDGRVEYLPTPGGVLVGILPDPRFVGTGIVLRPGDTLLLYTDGLTEARVGPGSARYGEQALLSFAENLAPVGAERLVGTVSDLLEGFGPGPDDDTAILALGVPPHRAHTPGRRI